MCLLASFSVISRRSDWMLWWAGEPLPAARLLPLPSRQHDRGKERVGDYWGPRSSSLRGPGVPVASPSFHRPGSTPGRPHQRQRPADEAASADPGGGGVHQPALVLFRPTAHRQDEAGRAEDLQRLCRSGDRQPASRNPTTSPESHACGKLMPRWGFLPAHQVCTWEEITNSGLAVWV